jgi:hypothetical protein
MAATERLVFRLKEGPGYVDGSDLCDSDLAGIPHDTVLLHLENADVSDAGIGALPDLPRLRCIDLDGTRIADAAMQRIGMFRNLEEIWIEGTAVSDRGLAFLHGLANLKFISILDCAEISDQAVAELRKAIPGVEVH